MRDDERPIATYSMRQKRTRFTPGLSDSRLTQALRALQDGVADQDVHRSCQMNRFYITLRRELERTVAHFAKLRVARINASC